MKIYDSQFHCFYSDAPEHPWPAGAVTRHGKEFTIEQALALMDKNGVEGAVLVPPSWNGWDNEYSLRAARQWPKRFGVMGRFDITWPDAPERLKSWREQEGMLGLRVFLMGDPWMSLLEEEKTWFWRIAEETRLPIMTTIPGHIAGYEPILARYPDLRLIIDHAGRHPLGPQDEAAWADESQLHALARYKNVTVKVSSLPCFSTQSYPFPNLHSHIRSIYDHFGPERMAWGSDVTRLTCPYEENIRLFTEALDFLSAQDREWIMGRALAKALDWNV